MADSKNPDPEMLNNLNLLLDLEVLKNEKDWKVIQFLHLPKPTPVPTVTETKDSSHEK